MFEKYKNNRVYKSLNIVENFLENFENISPEDRLTLLDDAFLASNDYSVAVENLGRILNPNGIRVFRERFKKYKYAHKDKKERMQTKSIRLSPDIHANLVVAKSKLGCDTDDEIVELLIEMAGL